MRFESTDLPGVHLVDLDRIDDERGFFARTWCVREARAAGLRGTMVQDSVGHNLHRGTLRGMHFHAPGFPQARVMRCIAGGVHAVVLDLRDDSPRRLGHLSFVLDARNGRAVYVPPGVALGYLTTADATTVWYQMPEYYDPAHERGVRWNDPAFAIDWPFEPGTIGGRDANYPDFDPAVCSGLTTAAGAAE